MQKQWKRILAIVAVLALLGVLLALWNRHTAFQSDRTAMLTYLHSISATTEQIESAAVTDWETGGKVTLSSEQLEPVLQQLQSLSPDRLQAHNGFADTGRLSLFLKDTDGRELLLKVEQETIFVSTDEATAALWNQRAWQIDAPSLVDCLEALLD